MIQNLLVLSPETSDLVEDIVLMAICLISLIVVLSVCWRGRDVVARSEADMRDRVLSVLDTYEDEDPGFVAEMRDLDGFLTPTAWITRVRTRIAQSTMSPQARADVMAASANFQVGAS